MKKRILASSMASVMALSAAGTALVSSAAVADFKDQAVTTRVELRKFIEDERIKWLAEDGGVDEYGTYSGERFMKAYALACNTADNDKATEAEIVAAFQILKRAESNLVQYDKVALAGLVNELSGIRKTENVLNEEYNLTIYKDESWSKFASAYDNAESYLESDDLHATTDAYEELFENKAPEEKSTTTKTKLEAAKKAYETALKLEYKYQPWQRGTVSSDCKVSDYRGKSFAWGVLYAYVESGDAALKAAYKEFDEAKNLRVTSEEKIVNAVDQLEKAASVLNSFKADTFESGSETKTKSLLKKYHGQLVRDSVSSVNVEAIVTDFLTKGKTIATTTTKAEIKVSGKYIKAESAAEAKANASNTDGEVWELTKSASTDYQPLSGVKKTTSKVLSAVIDVKATKTLYAVVTKTNIFETNVGKLLPDDESNPTEWFYTSSPSEATLGTIATANSLTSAADVKVVTINKGSSFKLSDYLEYDMEVLTGAAAADAAAAAAIQEAKDKIFTYTAADATAGTAESYGGDLKTIVDAIAAVDAAAVTAAKTIVDDTQAKNTKLKADWDAAASGGGDTSGINGGVEPIVDTTYAAKKTAVGTKVDAVKTKLTDLKTAIDALKTGVTVALVSAVVDAADNVTTALAELDTAKTAFIAAAEQDSNGTEGAAVTAPAAFTTFTTNAAKANKAAVETALDSDLTDLEQAIDDATAGSAGSYTFFGSVTTGTAAGTSPAFWYALNTVVDCYADLGKTISANFTWAADDESYVTVPNMALALTMAKDFYMSDPATWSTGIAELDYINAVTDTTKKTPKGEQIAYNYLKYALEDKYNEAAQATYGWRQVEAKVDEAYKLQESTVNCALFSPSHMALVDARNVAIQWLKDREITKPYTDKMTLVSGNNSTQAYNALQGKYKQLNDELSKFAYSYEEIIGDMAKVAKYIDSGKGTADMTKALSDVADAMLKVKPLEKTSSSYSGSGTFEDSECITDDGELKINNRVYTNNGTFKIVIDSSNHKDEIAKSEKVSDPNHSHKVLKDAYEKMTKLYNDATKAPAADPNDVDGSGKFDLADVTKLLSLFVNNQTDVAKHDFNKDGKVDISDVTTLLAKFVNG